MTPYKLFPTEASEEMLIAAAEELAESHTWELVYKAVLSAAPKVKP